MDDVQSTGFIEIAVYNDFAPYSYLDHQNEVAGIDIELGKEIARRLNVKPVWLWFAPDETLDDDLRNVIWKGRKIDRKKADLMLRAPYDRKFAHATDGYGLPKNDLVVMFAPYHAERWMIARDLEALGTSRSLAIFRYEKIGVELDSLPDFFLSGVFGGSVRNNVVHYKDIFSAVAGLDRGETAATVGMQSQLQWAMRKQEGRFDLGRDGLEQIGKTKWDVGMAVRHDFRQLAYAIEAIVEEMVNSGSVEQIFNRYQIEYVLPDYYTNLGKRE